MVVVKIGGSLQSTKYINRWIKEIRLNRDISFLLIFGGGKYVQKIRNDQKLKRYSDYEAHKLAIQGMKKYTLDNLQELKDFTVISSVKCINTIYRNRKLLVWMPSYEDVDILNIPLNWNATSDSIALAIANTTSSPLLVIKSVRLNCKKFINSFFLKQDLVDKHFSKNYLYNNKKISIACREKFYKLREICSYLYN